MPPRTVEFSPPGRDRKRSEGGPSRALTTQSRIENACAFQSGSEQNPCRLARARIAGNPSRVHRACGGRDPSSWNATDADEKHVQLPVGTKLHAQKSFPILNAQRAER